MGVPIHGYPDGLRASDPPKYAGQAKAARDLEHCETEAKQQAFATHQQAGLTRDCQPAIATVSSLLGDSYSGLVVLNDRLNIIAVRLSGGGVNPAGPPTQSREIEASVLNIAQAVRDLILLAHSTIDRIDSAL